MKVFPVLLIVSLALSSTVFGFMSLAENPLNAKAALVLFSGTSVLTVSGISIFDRGRK